MKLKYALAMGIACTAIAGLPLAGCGDDDDGGEATADGGGGGGEGGGRDSSMNPTDGAPGDSSNVDSSVTPHVPVLAKGPSNSSSVALSPDEARVVVANRDKGSVTVFSVTYGGAAPVMTKVAEVDVGVGTEPWQVAIDPAGDRAYVACRQGQKMVRIDGINTAAPKKGPEAAVGSEPTGLALSPRGTKAYVANWVDGTVSVVDTETMVVSKTIGLNAALVATGFLGTGVVARPALAHPRSIAITNNGNADETDESMYVTEYFGQRTEEELGDGSNADTSKVGVVYRVKLVDDSVTTISLAPLPDMGFQPTATGSAGCFPNQLQSVVLKGKFAYITSVCASPKGPSGVRATANTCDIANGNADCAGAGDVQEGICQANGTCTDIASVKTSTAPLVSVIDTSLATPTEVGPPTNLNKRFFDRYAAATPAVANDASRRLPLLANDLTFVPGSEIAYVSANGTNAVFRLVFGIDGTVTSVGSDTPLRHFIDLTLGAPQDFGNAAHGLLPTGLVAGSKNLLFVSNDVSRNVSVVDLATQTVAGGGAPVVVASSTKDASETAKLKGKLFFNTGLGRWSLRGQGWGACQSCHVDGLTDNVTWYFGRGPRQSTSLDGSFSSSGTVQRIFNWTAVFDDVADFEGNTRGVSGGVGATVKDTAAPIGNAQRIDLTLNNFVTGQAHDGLNGSGKLAADSKVDQFTVGMAARSKLDDWAEIETYIKGVRSPRGSKGVEAAKVTAGRALFTSNNCQGCHGGQLWTTSELFYTRTAANAFTVTETLLTKQWDVSATLFPAALTPIAAGAGTDGPMRAKSPNAGSDSLICALREVGTFGTAEPGAGIAELRQDMATLAQGSNPNGRGFSPPSLLGVAAAGPLLHAGNARTLEALFSDTFVGHHRALSANFLNGGDAADRRLELIHFLLSIDDSTAPLAVPAAPGANGGKLCVFP